MKMLGMDNWSRARRIAFLLFCVALFLGAFVPLLVDILINGRLGWSIIVLAAILMAWLIIAPWFILRRSRAAISWSAAAVSVPIFLGIVESLSPNKGWFLPLGLPAAAAGLAALGGILWLWHQSRLKFWYAAALSFILLGLVSFMEYSLACPFMLTDPSESIRQSVAIYLAGASILFALIAVLVHKLKPFKDRE
jgi:uncharacterized membrane protein YhaH (DUF805 family)